MKRRRGGFTLIELVIALSLIGIATAIGIPRLRDGLAKERVRGARREVTTLVARARAAAATRGCQSTLRFAGGGNARAWITACPVNGTVALDTVGSVEFLSKRFGVSMTSTVDTLAFSPLGIAAGSGWTSLSFAKSGYSQGLQISPLGRAVW